MKALLTHSRMRAARACQRLHLIRYLLGYRPVSDAAELRFGTLVHLGLRVLFETLAAGRCGDERLESALAALSGEADIWDRIRAEELIRGYHFRWDPDEYDVLGVEAEFSTPLRNPQTGMPSRIWDLAGAIDVLVRRRRDGLCFVMEHKTSSEDITPGSEYWRRLRMDGQVSTYFDGAAALGHDVAGCVYDVIGKVQLRPLKATPQEQRKYTKPTKAEPVSRLYAGQREHDETPEEYRARVREAIAAEPAAYYQRGEVARTEAELDEARFDRWQLAQQIRESELSGRAPRNPDACSRMGRVCPYFDVCSGAASLDDPTRFERSDVVHPELPGLAAQQMSEREQSNQQEAV